MHHFQWKILILTRIRCDRCFILFQKCILVSFICSCFVSNRNFFFVKCHQMTVSTLRSVTFYFWICLWHFGVPLFLKCKGVLNPKENMYQEKETETITIKVQWHENILHIFCVRYEVKYGLKNKFGSEFLCLSKHWQIDSYKSKISF